MELITKLEYIARTKSSRGALGFKIEGDEGWFSAVGGAVNYLEKMKKGDKIKIIYEQKGVNRNVTNISKVEDTNTQTSKETSPKTEDIPPVPKYICEDCGAELKDDKYKKCYKCNQKNPKDVQIQRGNALNSASAVLKGNFEGTNTDIEIIKQATLNLAESFLDWLRLE